MSAQGHLQSPLEGRLQVITGSCLGHRWIIFGPPQGHVQVVTGAMLRPSYIKQYSDHWRTTRSVCPGVRVLVENLILRFFEGRFLQSLSGILSVYFLKKKCSLPSQFHQVTHLLKSL